MANELCTIVEDSDNLARLTKGAAAAALGDAQMDEKELVRVCCA